MTFLSRLLPCSFNERRRVPRFSVKPEPPLYVGVVIPRQEGEPRQLAARVREIDGEGVSFVLPGAKYATSWPKAAAGS